MEHRTSKMVIYLFLSCFIWSLVLSSAPQTIRKKVQEESSSGSILVDLRKEFQLSDKFNKEAVKFRMFSGNDNSSKLLDFDEKGLLRSIGRLDREAMCSQLTECILKFTVATQPHFELVKVEIDIEDINDNAPQFLRSHMKTNISESTNPGKFFYVYLAKDPDSPTYGVVNYTLDPNQDPKNLEKFSLRQDRSPDGQIRDVILMSNEPLDREEQSSYLLKILAIDGGSPPKTGSATIEVTVLDLNEHSPEFVQDSFHVNVTENAHKKENLLQVRAVDKDADMNGNVKYSFSNKTLDSYKQYFYIDPQSGIIKQLKSLNYEQTPSIQLEVFAQDHGADPLTSKTTVTINIENVNDNHPKIRFEDTSDEVYGTTISEDAPIGTFIVQFSVSDDDGDAMGFIQCQLTLNQSKSHPYRMTRRRGTNDFTIETNSHLDRETSDRHLLLVNCHDGGQPPLSSTASYYVNITDVNDNSPKFSSTTYNITVLENNTPFEKNFYVRATDADKGLNGEVTYSLQSGAEGVFQIDEKSGALWTTVPLDREKNSFYILKVVAKDAASEPHKKSSTATVTVSVADMNDEPPRFKQPSYNFSITENKVGKSELGRVSAVDLDLDSKSVYLFEQNSGVSHRLFKIDSKTGMINVTRPLNREERELYTLQVIVRDEQAPHFQDTAIINVHVLDENDNPPIVEFPVSGNDTVYIARDTPINQAIAKVVAKDADLGNNSSLSYSISQSSPVDLFKIDPNTGEVFLNSSLPPDISAFNVVVMVKDLGTPPKMTIATLEVYVDSLSALHSVARPITVHRILTEAHLAVVVGVAAGCFLIIIFLICVVCSVSQRKAVKRPNKSPGVPKNKIAVETYESDVKFNPCHVEGGNSERGSQCMSSESRSQIRGSFIASDELDNSDALILANLNSDIPAPSPMTLDRRSSRLHSATSDVGINVGSGNYYQCDSPGLPTDTLYSNKSSAFKNVKYVDCCRLNSEIESGIYQSTRPIYTSSDYNDPNNIPPSSSPEWLMQAVHQRKQSFSRWLNCENPIKAQMYNIHEYSTIPSLNRLASSRFNEDPSIVTKSVIGNNQSNGDALGALNESHPLLMRSNFPVRSSPTYVGLYTRPFAPRPFLHGSSLENENVTLKSFQDKTALNHRSIAEEVPQML